MSWNADAMTIAEDTIRSLYRDGRFAEAVDFIRSLIKDASTRRGEEWRSIANAAMTLSDHHAARLAALRWGIEEPDRFEALLLAAQACARTGNEEHFRTAAGVLLKKFPGEPEAWMIAGTARAGFGDIDAGIAELKRAAALAPDSMRIWNAIAQLSAFGAGDPDFEAVAALPSRAGHLPKAEQAGAHYAAAAAFDARDDVDRAFEHYREGAALRRADLTHDMARITAMSRNALDSFEPDLFDRFRGAGAPSTGEVFLIGAPRSGTALIEQVLASHNRVFGAGEAGVVRMTTWPLSDFRPLFVTDIVNQEKRRPWLGLGENFTSFSREIYGDHLYTVYRGDLIAYAGVLRLMLPYAKIIFVDRDPVEAAWSAFRVNYAASNPWSFDFAEIAEWHGAYATTRAAWRERIGGETLDVSYEALIADPQREVKRMLKFIGLPPDPACGRAFETRRRVPLESVRRVRLPLDTASVARSRAYGARLDPLRRALELYGLASGHGALH